MYKHAWRTLRTFLLGSCLFLLPPDQAAAADRFLTSPSLLLIDQSGSVKSEQLRNISSGVAAALRRFGPQHKLQVMTWGTRPQAVEWHTLASLDQLAREVWHAQPRKEKTNTGAALAQLSTDHSFDCLNVLLLQHEVPDDAGRYQASVQTILDRGGRITVLVFGPTGRSIEYIVHELQYDTAYRPIGSYPGEYRVAALTATTFIAGLTQLQQPPRCQLLGM